MDDLGQVLVTGGAGFIGCSLSQQLAEQAKRWVVVDSLHPQVHPGRKPPEGLSRAAELRIGDVTIPQVWEDLLDDVQPDTVVHLAAETGTAQSLDEATRHASVNVVGTTAMLDAFARHNVIPRRFVLSSSRAVYGEGDWEDSEGRRFQPGMRTHAQLESGQWDFPGATPLPSSADRTVPSPTSVYGATKLAQEHVLTAWSGARGSQVSVLRLQNVYGPGQSLSNPYTGIVSLFSQIARRGESIPVYEDGLITRDFVFIDDVADAFANVLHRTPTASIERFDVGSGSPSTVLELATEIANYYDAPSPHVTGAYREGDVRYAACELDVMTSQFDWSAQWDLSRGVQRLQQWIADSA